MARSRRPAAETRAAMLEVAQALLIDGGPASVHLDAVAQGVGLTRQAVLHHFGSRAGLMRAVVERAWTGLFAALRVEGGAPGEVVAHIDAVSRKGGAARLGGWLLLSGEGLPDAVFEGALAEVVPREQAMSLLLAGAALFGDAVFGHRLRQALGMPDNEEERAKFRAFLVERAFPQNTT